MHEVRAEPLDHRTKPLDHRTKPLDHRTRSAGLETGEACPRTSHSAAVGHIPGGGQFFVNA